MPGKASKSGRTGIFEEALFMDQSTMTEMEIRQLVRDAHIIDFFLIRTSVR